MKPTPEQVVAFTRLRNARLRRDHAEQRNVARLSDEQACAAELEFDAARQEHVEAVREWDRVSKQVKGE